MDSSLDNVFEVKDSIIMNVEQFVFKLFNTSIIIVLNYFRFSMSCRAIKQQRALYKCLKRSRRSGENSTSDRADDR